MPLTRLTRFRRLAAAAAAVGALLVMTSFTGGARPALALSNCTVADMTFDAQEQEFLGLINAYRAQNGKPALTVSVNLNRSASWMAQDMAVKHYFSHTDSLGRSVSTRIGDCGGSAYNGENIAAGTIKDTAQEAFDMWRSSSGHNANMLNTSYRQIGIARYYDAGSPYTWYWATDFSTANDGTNASSAGSGGSDGSSGSGSGSVPAPPASTLSPIGVMTAPQSGATLGTSQTFTWAPGSDSRAYYFYMGTAQGWNNWLSVSMGTSTSLRVNGLPSTGGIVYVRLWSLTSSGWKYIDYSYRLP